MALKLSPELWVAWYIKSATNGRVIPARLRRLLTLVFIALCFWIIYVTVENIIRARQAQIAYEDAKSRVNGLRDGSINIHFFDAVDADEMASRRNELISEQQVNMWRAEREMHWYYAPLLYILYLIVVPWVLLKTIFWVVDAEQSKSRG